MSDAPDLQIPWGKPFHVGYCLSCLIGSRVIHSIPISAKASDLREIIPDPGGFIGESLSKDQFVQVFKFVIGSIALCWNPDFEFVIEGMNLPLDWNWDD
jgi:hypothetical protein